ncbi:MAG: hypothetical protein WAM60_15310 [Candidatus Promineifilaceae bacterium]
MNKDVILTPETAVERSRPRPDAYPVPQSGRNLIIFAWVVTILISTVPDFIFNELGSGISSWLVYAKFALMGVLALAAFIAAPLRPLRSYFIVMAAFFGLFEISHRIDFTLPFLQKLFGSTVFDTRMQAEQIAKLDVTLTMISILLLLGYKRRDFFLTRGNLRASIKPVPLLGFPKLSAYFFGITHYFGTPGGILGGLLSIFMGWILGKGMIETRGLFWT